MGFGIDLRDGRHRFFARHPLELPMKTPSVAMGRVKIWL